MRIAHICQSDYLLREHNIENYEKDVFIQVEKNKQDISALLNSFCKNENARFSSGF